MKVGKFTLIGLAMDCVDWIALVGMLPGIGDIFDGVCAMFWFLAGAGPVAAASVIELIPGADILPTNVAIGFYLDNKKKRGKKD